MSGPFVHLPATKRTNIGVSHASGTAGTPRATLAAGALTQRDPPPEP